ncbi:MAG: tape measure protein [Cyanobacteria bacterium J06649_12]
MVDAGRVLFQVGIDRPSADRAIADLERRLAAVGDVDLRINSQAVTAATQRLDSLFARAKAPEIDIQVNTDNAQRSVLTIESAIARLRESRNEITVNISNAQSNIAKLDADIKKLQDRKLIVEADSRNATAQIKLIDSQLKALNDEAIKISADDDASEKLIKLDAQIERLTLRRIRLTPKVENIDSELAALDSKIDGIDAKKIVIDADTRQAREQINRINETIKNLSGANAEEALKDLQREYRKTGDAAQKASKDTGSFNSILAGLSAGAAAVLIDQLVNAFGALTSKVTEFVAASVQANASLRATENALGIVLGSQQAAAESIDFLRQTAETTGQSFQVLQNEYAGITAAAAAAGIPQQQVNELFAETSRVLAIFGKDSTSTGLAFNALQQIASKGVVSMEELRQQLGEQLPVAFSAAADGLGITTAELNDLVASGNLTAAEFIPAITKGFKEIEGAAPAAQQAIAGLQTAIFDFQSSLGKSLEPLETAFSDTFAAIFQEVDVSSLDPLAEAGERLRDALADNPELAERLGEALSSVLAAGAEVTAELLDEITRILSKPENIERFASELESIADTILVVGSAAANSIDEILAIADAFTKVAERLVPSLRLLGVAEDIIQRLSNSKPVEIKGSVNFDESVSEGAAGIGVDLDNSQRTRLSREELSQKVQDNKEASDQIVADADRAAKAAAAARIKADQEAAEKFKQANLDAISAIDVAQSNRIAGVRQNQAAGNITEDEADAQISSIEIEGIQERIALREDEIAKIEDFASRKVISEKNAADQIRKANEGIADLTLEAIEKEIEAQDAAAAAAKDKAEEAVKAAESQLDAQQRLNDLQSEQINIQSGLALTALQDQASLIGAQADLEQSRLSLSRQTLEAKLAEATAIEDSVAVEELRDRILINQRQSIAAEFSARRQSLQIQQQQVSLDADRESRLGRIAEAEAKIALERAQLDDSTTDEELSGLEEIVKLREEQTDSLEEQARTQKDILALQLDQLDTDEQIAEQQATAERRQQAIEKSLKTQKDLADEQLKTEKALADATKDRANAAESIVSALSGLEDVSQADALGNLDQLEGNLGTARRAGVLDDDDANQLQSAINQAQRFSRGGFDVDEAFRFASQNEDNPFAGGVLDAVGLGGINSFFDAQQELQLADSQISTLTEEIRSVKAAIEQSFPDTIENNFNVGDTTDPYEQIAAITGAVARGARG